MSYTEEFTKLIHLRNLPKLVSLWQEYCANDRVDVDEFCGIMQLIHRSEVAQPFGKVVEEGLNLWQLLEDEEERYKVLKHLVDIQTNNSAQLADLAFEALKKRFAEDKDFNERIRLVGLRGHQSFTGAISNYELLAHMKKGNFVFHLGGWDVGQIVEVSPVLEQLSIDFEFVAGRKHFTFLNAFNTLRPLPSDHFLANRFADPDELEAKARKQPLEVIHWILRDLGPKTAPEIKEELCEIVIPEKDWAKWWQSARAKLKKDSMIQTPSTMKQTFKLRTKELTHQDMLKDAIEKNAGAQQLLNKLYSLVRDVPTLAKDQETKALLKENLETLNSQKDVPGSLRLQLALFYESVFNAELEDCRVADLIQQIGDFSEIINQIPVLALKKRALVAIRQQRDDWIAIFKELLFEVDSNVLRDYLVKELSSDEAKTALCDKINELLQTPLSSPEVFVWYFQKLMTKEGAELPFSDNDSLCIFFETFLVLYNQLETRPEWRDLLKKMYQFFSAKRFLIVRQLLEKSSIDFAKEYLLLISKCQTLSDHDIKIMRSLAEVAHRDLATQKKKKRNNQLDGQVIWTTEEGYKRTKQQIEHIGTIEIVENAREIEEARSHGDLRENSEYKYALEKRAQLQSQLKLLSDQLNRARIITPEDISSGEVGIGSIAILKSSENAEVNRYTILGPWDANPSEGILSFQSQLAQAMIGLKVGDTFNFRDSEMTLVELSTIYDRN